MTVFGPDGREWSITRRVSSPGLLAALVPGRPWMVEARADDEVRCWHAPSRRAAGTLADDVALALRTGASGPAGERSPQQAPDGHRGEQPHPARSSRRGERPERNDEGGVPG